MAEEKIDFDSLSYEETMALAEKAKEVAEQKRKDEIDALVAETREKFAKLGLDPQEIFGGKRVTKGGAPSFGNRA
jgi:thiamine pyrophosphokinase